MGKLVVVASRFLLLCGLLLAFPAVTVAQDTGRLLIDRVWTADENGTDKSVFTPGDAIRYVTLIRNTYNHPVKMKIAFLASGPTWLGGAGNPAHRDIYTYIQRDVIVPVGLAGYYSPWTIPASAQPGSYAASILICWNENSATPGTSCSGKATTDIGSFSIPGSLATTVTTFLPDGDTPTSAVGVAGPGEALLYKITVTNTGLPPVHNTGVVLTDRLPREIFDIIGTVTTDHGTCDKTRSWPYTAITCRLGSLAPGETATIYFTASIIVRHPSGEPRPPGNFINKFYVKSDQQRRATSSFVETMINSEEISCEDFNNLVASVENCVGLVPGIGTFAGFVWQTIGKPLQGGCQPRSYPTTLEQALALNAQELLQLEFDLLGERAGLKKVTQPVGAAQCIIADWIYYHNAH